jgi:hypothetical protein
MVRLPTPVAGCDTTSWTLMACGLFDTPAEVDAIESAAE